MMLKPSFISVLLVLAIGLSSWSIFISSRPTLQPAVNDYEPDAFMENVQATIIGKDGNPQLKIKSPKMLHYAINDRTHIETPYITVFRQSPEPWYINSEFAEASDGIEKIFFCCIVIIRHKQDISVPTTTMKTASLTVLPSKQQASTQDAIEVVQPDITIRALGMAADLNESTVRLLSNTRGEYVPSKS